MSSTLYKKTCNYFTGNYYNYLDKNCLNYVIFLDIAQENG